ncbi:MAG: MFS transporter, partial [Chloroflexota bacterium]|nr:MFS transporter [Chloroflexota bacterium]
ICMATLQAYLPPFAHAGRTLLLAVATFGLATLVFGVSTWFPLSLAALVLIGAMDNISVVVRKTLILLRTPDELRGRLSAVNNVFIGTSNQLGGFESGVAAAAFGPVVAVAIGGIGSALAVGAIAWAWPELRTLGRMTSVEADAANQGEEQVEAAGGR